MNNLKAELEAERAKNHILTSGLPPETVRAAAEASAKLIEEAAKLAAYSRHPLIECCESIIYVLDAELRRRQR